MRTLIITATILVPAAASAGGYLVPSMNPRDLALGGVAVADQNGPEATFLNTADLSSQEGIAIGVAGGVANNRTDWSASTLGSASLSQNSTPPSVAVSYGEKLPFDQAWGVGIGFGVPGGGTLVWPDNWPGQEVVRSVKTQYFRFGVNYTRYQATEEIHQALNYLDHVGDAGLGLSGGGNSIGVSTEIVPPQVPLKIGITYQHSSTIGLTGHVHFTDVPPAFQPMLHDQPISDDFVMPDLVKAGLAYEAIPGLRVMAAYSFENWSQYRSDHFVGDGGFVADVPRRYSDVHTMGVAGEWRQPAFLRNLTLRAGVTRDLSSGPPTDTLAPSLTDASRWTLSVGAGYEILPGLRADVGFQHQLLDSVTASGMDALAGTYKTAIDFLSVGVNWRMALARNK